MKGLEISENKKVLRAWHLVFLTIILLTGFLSTYHFKDLPEHPHHLPPYPDHEFNKEFQDEDEKRFHQKGYPKLHHPTPHGLFSNWINSIMFKLGFEPIDKPKHGSPKHHKSKHDKKHGKSKYHSNYAKNLKFDSFKYANINKYNHFELLAPIEFLNATQIFNSINSVVDGPAGTIQPNGVGVFTGYIPEGTLFYHAGFAKKNGGMPESPEWVAMHYEYSYDFGSHGNSIVRPGQEPFERRPKRPPPGEKPDGPPPLKDHTFEGHPNPRGLPPAPPNQGVNSRQGLLTFTNTKPLNKLIVMEGASAKKEDDGTMDMHNILAKDNFTNTFWFGERTLVKSICDWGDSKFGGLDGIVRMEVGFEIIFCHFENNDKIKLVSNDTYPNDLEILKFPNPLPLNQSLNDSVINPTDEQLLDDTRYKLLQYLPHIRSWENYERHYEIENRIKIDYRGFTTFLNKTFLNPDTYIRRLNETSDDLKDEFINQLEEIFIKNENDINYWDGNNWQEYTKHIISKYNSRLLIIQSIYNNFDEKKDLNDFGINLTMSTYHYYKKYQEITIEDEEYRELQGIKHAIWEYCSPKKVLQSNSDLLIWSSISKVMEEITKEIFWQFRLSRKILNFRFNDLKIDEVELLNEIEIGNKRINKLINDLNWTINTTCDKKCPINSICYIPTWGPSPFWDLSRSNFDRELVDGIWKIKKNCECIAIDKVWELPDYKF